VCLQDQSENVNDGDLYDDVITSRDDPTEEVCCRNQSLLFYCSIISLTTHCISM